jgi:enamine deaminase RidA (YjgF/YER057c/UK114 family)
MSQLKIERLDTNHVMSSTTIFNKVVYLSGQVPKNTELDIFGQTKEVLNTIDGLLAQAKTDKSRILSAQLFLKNLDDFQTVNTIWIDWLKEHQTPARATIQADLVNPDWLIEIAVIAAQYD